MATRVSLGTRHTQISICIVLELIANLEIMTGSFIFWSTSKVLWEKNVTAPPAGRGSNGSPIILLFVTNVLYVLYKRKIYTAKTKIAHIHRHPSEVSPSISRRSPGFWAKWGHRELGRCLEAPGQRKGRLLFTMRAGSRTAFVCPGPLFIFKSA